MTKKIKTIADLTPDAANLNKGTERGRYLLETSVSKLGLGRSVLADKNGTLIAGNKTTEVAGGLGMDKVRVIETDGTELIVVQRTDLDMTDPDDPRARQLAFADNQVGAQNLAWDAQALLTAAQADDLSDFVRDDELKAMIESAQEEESNTGGNSDVDAEPQINKAKELRAKWGVETGQLWALGDHRLLCGDSTSAGDVEHLMRGDRADVCLTDPPYGLGSGKASGKNEYDQHEDTRENLIRLIAGWLPIARDISSAVVFSPGVTNAWLYPEADWMMCWFYGGGQLRSSWGFNCWQPFLCYGKDPSLANGKGGRPDAVDMNTPANAGDIDHPCPKPVKLWQWFLERLTFKTGAIIYEPFSGSGTTIIACEQLGRKCRAIEISPAYVAVALQRWVDATGKTPKLLQ